MRKIMLAVLGLAFLSPTALQAQAQPATVSPVSAARASDMPTDTVVDTVTDEKVICRRDKEIGSRVKARKICMTKAQWAVTTAEQRNLIEQRQAQRTYTDNGS